MIPRDYQPLERDINTHGFTSQRVGPYLLLIYPPPFDPQQNEEEIARERSQQVRIDSVEVEITDDLYEDSQIPALEIEEEDLPFYRLTVILYKGVIINWLQREYGEHVEVGYTLYEEYLVVGNNRSLTEYRANLSDLLLLNQVIKRIVHDGPWNLPENPEFDYECLINIRGSILCFQIEGDHYEFRGRRLL